MQKGKFHRPSSVPEGGKSARASPTPHLTLNEERNARFTAQPLSALKKACFIKSFAPRPPLLFCPCVKHAKKNNLERFFFSFRVDFYCQEASCRKIRKETEKLIEASYRYCSSIRNDSNNMYHEGVIYSKVLNFKQEALKGSLKKRGY